MNKFRVARALLKNTAEAAPHIPVSWELFNRYADMATDLHNGNLGTRSLSLESRAASRKIQDGFQLMLHIMGKLKRSGITLSSLSTLIPKHTTCLRRLVQAHRDVGMSGTELNRAYAKLEALSVGRGLYRELKLREGLPMTL